MSLAIDIKGLQDIVGGELVPYQEIVRDEKAARHGAAKPRRPAWAYLCRSCAWP